MKKKYFVLLILFCGLTLVSGCFSSQNNTDTTNSKLTVGEVKRQISKGVTTQSEVLQLFGSPNLVTKDKDGHEIWAYNKMSYQTNVSGSGGTLILFGASQAMSSTTTKSFDLIITFDAKDIVKDYNVVYSSY